MLKQLSRSPASEDLIQGQGVIIAARWVLILARSDAVALESGRSRRPAGCDRPDPGDFRSPTSRYRLRS